MERLRHTGWLVLVTLTVSAAPLTLAQERYLGEIFLVGFTFCPRGSAAADGQLLAINSNQALFSLYGTTYGGDGRTTFALPDLRGRVPLHAGSGPGLSAYREGQAGGAETVTLSEGQLPAHTHAATTQLGTITASLKAAEEVPNSSSAEGAALADAKIYTNQDDADLSSSLKAGSVVIEGTATTNVEATGSGQPVEVTQPYLTLRYCVALTGLFPSRN